ncbi:SHOCT domain-containing protein [Halorubrum sp. CBA1229]|uniref:SHOCT domain-containing protein n=1 Tax=Halorubrum sp. CBA1229 TaxID=1853699 RepID=UPI0020D15499|nr:SHOCT domain-containing protein [Halorubrum sp. CBA1229]
MTTFDRAERAAAGVAVAAFAGIAFLALAVGTPTASATGGTGVTSGGTVAGTGVTSTGTAGPLGMMGGGMMGGGMMGGAGGFPFVFFPFMFLTFAALLALGYVGIRAMAGPDESGQVDTKADDEETDPIARLQRRYTEGELTEAEFERALERELGGEETDGGVDRADDERDIGGASAERSLSGRER